MARRSRYREFESLMAKVMTGDTAVFILYLVFAGKGWAAVKIIAAVLVFLISVLSIVWLFFTKELFRRRSLWMATGFVSLFLCLLFSLILKYPCPPVITAG